MKLFRAIVEFPLLDGHHVSLIIKGKSEKDAKKELDKRGIKYDSIKELKR